MKKSKKVKNILKNLNQDKKKKNRKKNKNKKNNVNNIQNNQSVNTTSVVVEKIQTTVETAVVEVVETKGITTQPIKSLVRKQPNFGIEKQEQKVEEKEDNKEKEKEQEVQVTETKNENENQNQNESVKEEVKEENTDKVQDQNQDQDKKIEEIVKQLEEEKVVPIVSPNPIVVSLSGITNVENKVVVQDPIIEKRAIEESLKEDIFGVIDPYEGDDEESDEVNNEEEKENKEEVKEEKQQEQEQENVEANVESLESKDEDKYNAKDSEEVKQVKEKLDSYKDKLYKHLDLTNKEDVLKYANFGVVPEDDKKIEDYTKLYNNTFGTVKDNKADISIDASEIVSQMKKDVEYPEQVPIITKENYNKIFNIQEPVTKFDSEQQETQVVDESNPDEVATNLNYSLENANDDSFEKSYEKYQQFQKDHIKENESKVFLDNNTNTITQEKPSIPLSIDLNTYNVDKDGIITKPRESSRPSVDIEKYNHEVENSKKNNFWEYTKWRESLGLNRMLKTNSSNNGVAFLKKKYEDQLTPLKEREAVRKEDELFENDGQKLNNGIIIRGGYIVTKEYENHRNLTQAQNKYNHFLSPLKHEQEDGGIRQMDEKEIFLTQEGYNKLEAELNKLKIEERADISERLKVARSYGDLSENSEYEQAKLDQEANENKIAEIEYTLKQAKIIDTNDIDTSEVQVGNTVYITNIATKKELKYTIVGAAEANVVESKVSNESPIGKSLLGAKVGDVVKVEAPAGIIEYKVKKITLE